MNADNVSVYMGMCVFFHLCVCVCIPLHLYIPLIEIFTLVFEQAVISIFCFDHKSCEELLYLIINCIFIALFILYFTNEAAVYPQKNRMIFYR